MAAHDGAVAQEPDSGEHVIHDVRRRGVAEDWLFTHLGLNSWIFH
jgi:hypothetical protein